MRCVAGLLLLSLVCAQDLNPQLPPALRVEEVEALEPVFARKRPIAGTELEVIPQPSPSNIPFPIPVDTKRTVVGNCIEHRQYMDFPENMEFVFPGIGFGSAGAIDTWEVYTGRNCELYAQVFRSGKIPKALDENKYKVSPFTLVGQNKLSVPSLGSHTFSIPEDQRIHVQPGDVIGFHTEDPGCVSWSASGPTALYRYGIPGRNEMKIFGGHVFIGDGLQRTYSIACHGNFSHPDLVLAKRDSPSASPSIQPSQTPTSSPSHSPSLSSSISAAASWSPSRSSTPGIIPATTEIFNPNSSPNPNPSHVLQVPTNGDSGQFAGDMIPIHDPASECARGFVFWCASERNMQLCNVTKHICDLILHEPKPSPSHTPTPTQASPTPSTSLPIHFPAPSSKPSPTPSTSLVVPPYLQDRVETGLTQCMYCNGGSDWTVDTCTKGTQQSPVSMRFDNMNVPAELDLYFAVRYNLTKATLHWDNAAFTLKSSHFGGINIDAVNYVAEMVKIRAPSEHKLEGMRTPLEFQIFHRLPGSNPPKILAVSILFEETITEVEKLDWLLRIPQDKSDFEMVVDLEDYLTDLKPLAFYDGSMTEPPCQEGVTWAVSMGTGKVNFKQLKFLNSFLKDNRAFALGRGNNRQVQPLGSRQVTLRSNCGISGAMSCGREKKSEGEGDIQNRMKALSEGHADALSVASQRENELAAAALKDVQSLAQSTSDDSMFDDGDVKLW